MKVFSFIIILAFTANTIKAQAQDYCHYFSNIYEVTELPDTNDSIRIVTYIWTSTGSKILYKSVSIEEKYINVTICFIQGITMQDITHLDTFYLPPLNTGQYHIVFRARCSPTVADSCNSITKDIGEAQEQHLPLEVYLPTDHLPVDTFLVTPNPAYGQQTLIIKVEEETTLKAVLYDALGRCVQQVFQGKVKPGGWTYDFDVASLAAGYYYLHLDTGDKMRVLKVVKY